MIGYLNGKIIETNGSIITILVGGIGFNVMMPKDGALLFNLGDEVGVYTYMHVRENDIALYGFTDIAEKEAFNLLITVSGIGPRSAMQMLGAADFKSILYAIHGEDEKMLSSLPGVGKKTAARLILELHEKVEKQFPEYSQAVQAEVQTNKSKKKSLIEADLTDALSALGYQSYEIKKIYETTDILDETDINIALKKALQYLF